MAVAGAMGWTAVAGVVFGLAAAPARAAPDVEALQLLGKYIFFDRISHPPRQACASCHVPEMGWTGKNPRINRNGVAIPGANPHAVGGRKPPSNAYSSFSPPFGTTLPPGLEPLFPPGTPGCDTGIGPFCVGGVFWDGRAEGRAPAYTGTFFTGTGATTHVGPETLLGLAPDVAAAIDVFRGPVADQALGPFANDVEQNVIVLPGDPPGLPGATAVCLHVKLSRYSALYEQAYGVPPLCRGPDNAGTTFKRIALAVAAWQHSSEVNSFSSPRDDCIGAGARKDHDGVFPCDNLSDEANLGHDLFWGRNDTGRNRFVGTNIDPLTGTLTTGPLNANCAFCHNSGRSVFGPLPPRSSGNEPRQVYTDHAYHHIGLPANHQIENHDPARPDYGLSHHANPAQAISSPYAGHVRTPTLRNVDKRRGGVVKAYMHNGYFKSLEDIVHFYNTASEPSKLDPYKCPPGTTAAEARARNCWPAPEVPAGTSRGLLFGRLGLTDSEEAALVAYLKALSDTRVVRPPPPYRPR